MRPGFVEQLEVLARRAPEYYVKRYERTGFVSRAKTAPVYSPGPPGQVTSLGCTAMRVGRFSTRTKPGIRERSGISG